MATATLVYEHTVALSMTFKSLGFSYGAERMISDKKRPDGEIMVLDKGYGQRTITISAKVTGAQMAILDGWITGAITHGATYPRIATIYFSDSATIENMLVYMPTIQSLQEGQNMRATITFKERTV